MKYLLVALTLGGLLAAALAPANAADWKPTRYRAAPAERFYVLPFPRSERAQSVWASSACWSDCGRSCAWGLIECVETDAQGHCLKITDRCDRYCQRECRTTGGPLLPIE